MISFLASSLVVGRVAERARRQARQAEQRREDVERLYTLSQEMMLYEDAAGLIRDLPSSSSASSLWKAWCFMSATRTEFYSSTSELPMSMQASLSAVTHGPALRRRCLPGELTTMPLMLGMRPVGALGWRPAVLSREVATAVSAQVAIALARALAIEASARAWRRRARASGCERR